MGGRKLSFRVRNQNWHQQTFTQLSVPFDNDKETIVARWVKGSTSSPYFDVLVSVITVVIGVGCEMRVCRVPYTVVIGSNLFFKNKKRNVDLGWPRRTIPFSRRFLVLPILLAFC
jgi:hypothetical protein